MPKPTDRETVWSKHLAETRFKGIPEYRLYTGLRCDILGEEYIWEVEWIKKWYQAIGQVAIYSALSNLKPGIILLARGKPDDKFRYLHCLAVCNKYGIRLEIVDTCKS